jgi:hypothetical protein
MGTLTITSALSLVSPDRFMVQDRELVQGQLQAKQKEIENEITNLVKKRKVSKIQHRSMYQRQEYPTDGSVLDAHGSFSKSKQEKPNHT